MSSEQMDLSDSRQRARDYLDSLDTTNKGLVFGASDSPQFDEFKALDFPRLVDNLALENPDRIPQHAFEDLVILCRYLEDGPPLGNQVSTRHAVIVARDFMLQTILPGANFAMRPPHIEDDNPEMSSSEIAQFHALSSQAISNLSYLDASFPILKKSDEHLVALLVCLSSFTDLSDPWTCENSRSNALVLLETTVERQNGEYLSKILSRVLQERIKPAFAKTATVAISQQGRKASYPLPVRSSTSSDDTERLLWKYRDVYIVTVLGWLVRSLGLIDSSFMEANWPLLTRSLLALIDDSSITYKSKGCAFLDSFLQRVPPPLLDRTGLGEVFEDILFSCLTYLPTMTEEAGSLILLAEVYPALIRLVHVRYPQEKDRVVRMKALDRIIHNGILKSYGQAAEYVKIADLFVKQMERLVNEMGIDFVKHLKHILPLLWGNLAAPFALAYPPLVLSSLEAIQTIILVVWPRLSHHRGEILKGLTLCWCKIVEEEENSADLETIRRSLQSTVNMLTVVLEREVDIPEEYQSIANSDQRLQKFLAS